MDAVSSAVMGRSPWKDLVGEWEMRSPIFQGARGLAVFEWLEGGAYLALRSQPPQPAPASVWLIGADDSDSACTVLYADSRGVSRVYRTSFVSGVWIIERHGQPFSQRFEGRLEPDMKSIKGAWHSAEDDGGWKMDFELA